MTFFEYCNHALKLPSTIYEFEKVSKKLKIFWYTNTSWSSLFEPPCKLYSALYKLVNLIYIEFLDAATFVSHVKVSIELFF